MQNSALLPCARIHLELAWSSYNPSNPASNLASINCQIVKPARFSWYESVWSGRKEIVVYTNTIQRKLPDGVTESGSPLQILAPIRLTGFIFPTQPSARRPLGSFGEGKCFVCHRNNNKSPQVFRKCPKCLIGDLKFWLQLRFENGGAEKPPVPEDRERRSRGFKY